MDMQKAYDLFFDRKKSINLSDETLETYRLHIDNFMDAIGAYLSTDKITAEVWYDYISYLQEDDNKSEQTVLSYCRSVRAFLYFLMDENLSDNIQLKLPKASEKVKDIYTADEIKILLRKPEKGCSEVEYQTWVFINLIMSTGLRLSSALALTVSDYNAKENILIVNKTKQKKGQRLLLNKDMCNILNSYIRLFMLDNNSYLFPIAEGTALKKRSMQDNVATYNNSRNVKKTSIHLMRHTFASNYIRNGGDIYSLQHILGHSDIATTQKYLKSLDCDVRDIGTTYNPQLLYSSTRTNSNKKRRGKMTRI